MLFRVPFQVLATDVSNGMLKGVEKRKANLEAKIKSLTFDIENRKDDVVDFKLMGIDHLLVDESHYQNFLIFLFDILNILKFSIFFI